MDTFIDSDAVGDAGEDLEGAIIEKFLGFVSDNAKPCITKAIDYTLLVAVLILQFLNCKPLNAQELVEKYNSGDLKLNTTSVYSCNASDEPIIFSSSSKTLNILIMIAVAIGLSYGIIMAIAIWIHSKYQAKDIKVHSLTEKLYKFTDRIIIIDSLLEIPISFFWAPLVTLMLWGFFAVAVTGFFLIARLYNDQVKDDENAKAVFTSSTFLVIFSLFKLTGDISQYWVKFVTSTVEDADDKMEQYEESKKRGNFIQKSMRKLRA